MNLLTKLNGLLNLLSLLKNLSKFSDLVKMKKKLLKKLLLTVPNKLKKLLLTVLNKVLPLQHNVVLLNVKETIVLNLV